MSSTLYLLPFCWFRNPTEHCCPKFSGDAGNKYPGKNDLGVICGFFWKNRAKKAATFFAVYCCSQQGGGGGPALSLCCYYIVVLCTERNELGGCSGIQLYYVKLTYFMDTTPRRFHGAPCFHLRSPHRNPGSVRLIIRSKPLAVTRTSRHFFSANNGAKRLGCASGKERTEASTNKRKHGEKRLHRTECVQASQQVLLYYLVARQISSRLLCMSSRRQVPLNDSQETTHEREEGRLSVRCTKSSRFSCYFAIPMFAAVPLRIYSSLDPPPALACWLL